MLTILLPVSFSITAVPSSKKSETKKAQPKKAEPKKEEPKKVLQMNKNQSILQEFP